ncbi:MAG TPA: hypothetical protein VMH83_03950, partial [Candidatus Acidoferrum sp.]|nr:hypothetical protein [Candidatus Acidoferrum sp.]
DFYIDKELWKDKRYFRCNSPFAMEAQWGANQTPVIGDHPPQSAAWGYCDRDYPREQIVSPYKFKTAKAHYEALLAEAKARGGPTQYTKATLPDWNGNYRRQYNKLYSWFDGAILQIPTYLSLLTPKYQQYYVQQMYHYGNTNASQWPGSYCWPEGFLRRLSYYGGITSNIMLTTEMMQDLRRGANAMISHIQFNRSFNESGAVPRLGADVPRWYGETIGFWDGDALITWTSNVQGWISHGAFEYSNQMQSVEIWTPFNGKDGKFQGLRHEVILYDPEALVEPVRIVHYMDKVRELNQGDPFEVAHCEQKIFPINGRATPVVPGQTIEFTLPDLYGRPWAQVWEKYFEQGMKRPAEVDLFHF